MVTAELAACLPVLMLLVAFAISVVTVCNARVRAQDAAREAARVAARGDSDAEQVGRQVAPGAALEVANDGERVTAVATLHVHVVASWLPAFTVRADAVAAVEPQAASP